MRIKPPHDSGIFFEHQPEMLATFNRFYGEMWSRGLLDQPTKEVARIRNARLVDCNL